MGLYRKKPVVIEAIQFTGDNKQEVIDFMRIHNEGNGFHFEDIKDLSPEKVYIHTLEGEVTASRGDWIIKGVQGEFYPCKPDIFEATYEPA